MMLMMMLMMLSTNVARRDDNADSSIPFDESQAADHFDTNLTLDLDDTVHSGASPTLSSSTKMILLSSFVLEK